MTTKNLCLKIFIIKSVIICIIWLTLQLLFKCCSRPFSDELVAQKLSWLTLNKTRVKKCYKNGTYVDIDNIELEEFPNGIPKLQHSTWKTQHLPNKKWQLIEKNCRKKNQEFVFCHWDDRELEYFVSSHRVDFLNKFLTYPYPIQKADVVRYLLLENYGGFYKDVNINCRAPFSHMIQQMSSVSKSFKVLLAHVKPSGVAADFIAATPHHSFFKFTTNLLASRPQRYGLPYIDVILGTGPMFLSESYHNYMQNKSIASVEKDQLVFLPDRYIEEYFVFMSGGTWHCVDGMVIWTVYNNRNYLLKLFLVFIAFVCLSLIYKRNLRFRNKHNGFAKKCWISPLTFRI